MKQLPEEYAKRVERAFLQGLPPSEIDKALGYLEVTGQCPFRGQVKFRVQPRKDMQSGEWSKELIIITGIEGYRSRANATGRYMADDELPAVVYENGLPVEAIARVRIRDTFDNKWSYIPHRVRWSEYAERLTEKKTVNGYPKKVPVGDGTKLEHYQGNWRTKAETMITKCAEAGALRKAFPDELGGSYIDEEIAAETESAPASDPFTPTTKYVCAECGTEVTPAQASATLRAFDRHLCEAHEVAARPQPAARPIEPPTPITAKASSTKKPAKPQPEQKVPAAAPITPPAPEGLPGVREDGVGDRVSEASPATVTEEESPFLEEAPPVEEKKEAPASSKKVPHLEDTVGILASWAVIPRRLSFVKLAAQKTGPAGDLPTWAIQLTAAVNQAQVDKEAAKAALKALVEKAMKEVHALAVSWNTPILGKK